MIRVFDWIFGSPRNFIVFAILAFVAALTPVGYALYRYAHTDDTGNRCPNGLVWRMPDEGVCYRECVLAATKNQNPAWATEYCVREACQGYTKICRE